MTQDPRSDEPSEDPAAAPQGTPVSPGPREPGDREPVHPAVTGFAYVAPAFDAVSRFVAARLERAGVTPPSGMARSPAAPEPEPDHVRFDQLGGLDQVVAQLREVADSFRHPQVMARWGATRPQGVLMWGPPGTGKTTLAKALAVEIGGTLKEIRTPDILDKWVGTSERNIRRIFTEARKYRTPTVLLFDEFDSIITYTGSPESSADHAVNSVAGIFKQEMNGLIKDNPNVIVVATTNFPDRVDASLTRSGRFDVKIAVPLPDERARADILATLIATLMNRHEIGGFRMFADDIDTAAVARRAIGMSGADLKEVLRRVQLAKAIQEARSGTSGPITQDDVMTALAAVQAHGR
jgi:transitional endoplasmic reticulum ATPase